MKNLLTKKWKLWGSVGVMVWVGFLAVIPGWSATDTLHHRIAKGDLKGLAAFSGKDMNKKDHNGDFPLHVAVRNDREAVVRWLIRQGVNMNAVNAAGDTALHIAVDLGRPHLVTILLKSGANGTLKNKRGLTPIQLAREKGFVQIAEILFGKEKRRTDRPKDFSFNLENFSLEERDAIEEMLEDMSGTASLRPKTTEDAGPRWKGYWLKSHGDGVRVQRKLKKMMKRLNIRAMSEFSGNEITFTKTGRSPSRRFRGIGEGASPPRLSHPIRMSGLVGMSPPPGPTTVETEKFDRIETTGFLKVLDNPRTTFSIDVDTAAYSHMRRYLLAGRLPPVDSIRIEEWLNYFSYDYPEPEGDLPFSFTTEASEAPWNPEHRLVHIGLRGKNFPIDQLPPSNLVFLVDVSGSMTGSMPLVKASLKMLISRMRPQDRAAIVVYAGAAGMVLPPTGGEKKATILDALENLRAGGSTAGGEGIRLAYRLARENRREGDNNRVILVTDGDFNVGRVSRSDLTSLVEAERKSGVFLSVFGFGRGNINNATMELLADKGNGHFVFVDSLLEAQKALSVESAGLHTIAKDVKIQVEFNPAKVAAYRLIGYENRKLQNEDFHDDKKDAGEIGAGHTVTALYEVVSAPAVVSDGGDHAYVQTTVRPEALLSNALATIRFRYKSPEGSQSRLIEKVIVDQPLELAKSSNDFRFSSAVAAFGLLLRNSEFKGKAQLAQVLALAEGAKGVDKNGYRAEFIQLVKLVGNLGVK